MRLTRIWSRYDAAEGKMMPRGWGIVDRVELYYIIAPIPLNLIFGWWRWLWYQAMYPWTPLAVRWERNRRAIRMAMERGREAGFNQGQAHVKIQMGRAWTEFVRSEKREEGQR